jgi:hypothetical protein
MSVQQHLKTLGGIYITLGALGVLIAIVVFATMGAEELLSGDVRTVAAAITSDVRAVAACFGLLAGVPEIIGGIGLIKRKAWSWSLIWIVSCLILLSIPIGTAIGVYALWVLTRPEAQQFLGVGANASLMMRAVKVSLVLSLLLIIASFPACYLGEHAVQSELSKLSPTELELRQFDMVYVRWVLPGIIMFFWGLILALIAIVSWIIERRRVRQKTSA